MSWVTNVLVSVHPADERLLPGLSDWLEHEAPRRAGGGGGPGVGTLGNLTEPFDRWGGWKAPECRLWGGALNYCDLDALLRRVGGMPWQNPDCVQLFIMDQEDMTFRPYMFHGGALTAVPLPP
jgi:hypothetical protein